MAAVINNLLSSNLINILVIKNIPCTNQVLLVKICYYLQIDQLMINCVLTLIEKKVLVGWLGFFSFFLVYFTACGHNF